MKLQILKSGMKNKNGVNYITGVTAFITNTELKKANININDEVEKIIVNNQIIIKKIKNQ